MTGYVLEMSIRGQLRRVRLSPEAFLSARSGTLFAFGDSDGRTSRVRVVDLAASCILGVFERAGVVRGALIDRRASLLHHHAVGPDSRRDLGVFSAALGELDAYAPVMPPLPPEERLGRTSSTTLMLGPDRELVVQSCAEGGCRTRIREDGATAIARYDAPGQGRIVRVTPSALIVRAAGCDSQPCALMRVDRETGEIEPLER